MDSAITLQSQTHRLSFQGNGETLFGIWITNVFFNILTLGIYSFWGKTKIRTYLYGQTELEKDRFTYHGTGQELLFGWIKALLFFAPFLISLKLIPFVWQGPLAQLAAVFIFYLGLAIFIPLAVVGSHRYRLSRTSWRGIRFSFRGHTLDFAKIFLRGIFFTVMTLGLYYPFFHIEIRNFLTKHAYFGNKPFEFDGQGKDLFKSYLLNCLLYIPTLGLYSLWFMAAKQRYDWEHTSFDSVRFRSTVTGGKLLKLLLTNALLLIFTLGLAWTWVKIRTLSFDFNNLVMEGTFNLESVQQHVASASATGDELSSFLDTNFLDIEFGL